MTMDGNEAAELVQIGQKIIELGSELKLQKLKQAEVNERIATIQSELAPLLIRHSELISEVAGLPMTQTKPKASPQVLESSLLATKVGEEAGEVDDKKMFVLKQKIKTAMAAVEPGETKSAEQFAEDIHENPLLVRTAMREMMHRVGGIR